MRLSFSETRFIVTPTADVTLVCDLDVTEITLTLHCNVISFLIANGERMKRYTVTSYPLTICYQKGYDVTLVFWCFLKGYDVTLAFWCFF